MVARRHKAVTLAINPWCMLSKAVLGALMILIADYESTATSANTGQSVATAASPSASSTTAPSPPPSPSPSAADPPKARAPATIGVRFTGVPAGTFPTHVHSVCSGSQTFHITVVQSLAASAGSGTIQVPSGYFGRGLCLIVYTNSSLSRVLTTRPI